MELGALCVILASIVVLGGRLHAAGGDLDADLLRGDRACFLSQGLQLLDLDADPHLIKVVAEVTLVWVLFADASRVRLR